MSNLDIAVACALLAAATVVFIFMVQPDASDSAPHRTKLDQLMERRDAIYENLRDLRFEYRAGKFSESDYEETKQCSKWKPPASWPIWILDRWYSHACDPPGGDRKGHDIYEL